MIHASAEHANKKRSSLKVVLAIAFFQIIIGSVLVYYSTNNRLKHQNQNVNQKLIIRKEEEEENSNNLIRRRLKWMEPETVVQKEVVTTTPLNVTATATATTSQLTCEDGSCFVTNACLELNDDNNGMTILVSSSSYDGTVTNSIKAMQQNLQEELWERDLSFIHIKGGGYSLRDIPKKAKRAAVIDRPIPGNCGHALGDQAFPIVRNLMHFEQQDYFSTSSVKHDKLVVNEVNQNNITKHPPLLDDLYEMAYGNTKCDDILEPLVTNRVYRFHDLLAQQKKQQSKIVSCYDRIYFGSKGISYHKGQTKWQQDVGHDIQALRSIFYQYAGVSDGNSVNNSGTITSSTNPSTGTTAKGETVLIMEKKQGDHMSNLANLEEIKATIRSVRYSPVEIATWSEMTIREQIELLSQTKIMISLPGSDVMNAVFLPDHAHLLMFCRVVNDAVRSSNEVPLWLSRVLHLHIHMDDCNTNSNDQQHVTYDFHTQNTDVDAFWLELKLHEIGLALQYV